MAPQRREVPPEKTHLELPKMIGIPHAILLGVVLASMANRLVREQ